MSHSKTKKRHEPGTGRARGRGRHPAWAQGTPGSIAQLAENRWTDVVEREVDEVRHGQRKDLDLNRWRFREPLTKVPAEVFELTHLESLSLAGNQIRAVPDDIRRLPQLTQINLARNPIEQIPNIPGVMLDWNSYFRCRQVISRTNEGRRRFGAGGKPSRSDRGLSPAQDRRASGWRRSPIIAGHRRRADGAYS